MKYFSIELINKEKLRIEILINSLHFIVLTKYPITVSDNFNELYFILLDSKIRSFHNSFVSMDLQFLQIQSTFFQNVKLKNTSSYISLIFKLISFIRRSWFCIKLLLLLIILAIKNIVLLLKSLNSFVYIFVWRLKINVDVSKRNICNVSNTLYSVNRNEWKAINIISICIVNAFVSLYVLITI